MRCAFLWVPRGRSRSRVAWYRCIMETACHYLERSHDLSSSLRLKIFLLTKDDLKLRHAVPPESTAGPRMSICLFYSSWLAWTCFWIFFSAYLQVGGHWQPSLKFENTSYACGRRSGNIIKHYILIKHSICVYKNHRIINAASHLLHLSTRLFVAPSWSSLNLEKYPYRLYK